MPVRLPRPLAALLLTAILFAGFALRLALAPAEGFGFDLGTNMGWGRGIVHTGVALAYRIQEEGVMRPNYPPFSLMYFGAAMQLYHWLSPDFEPGTLLARVLIKLPAILMDLALTGLLYGIVARLKGRLYGLVAALMFALHPAIWYESAVWGQTDISYTLFCMLSMWLLLDRQYVLGGAAAALALFAKFQAIMFFPIIGVIALALAPKRIPAAVGGFTLMGFLVLLPFMAAGTTSDALEVLTRSVGDSTDLSLNAYNFWWSLFTDASRGTPDTHKVFGLISYRMIGLIITGTFYAVSMLWLWGKLRAQRLWSQQMTSVLIATSVCAYAFFLFNTEMHERYLFSLMAFGLPLPFIHRKFMAPYLAASVLFFWNLIGVLPLSDYDHAVYLKFPALDGLIATLQMVTFAVFFRRAYGFNWQRFKVSSREWFGRMRSFRFPTLRPISRPAFPSARETTLTVRPRG